MHQDPASLGRLSRRRLVQAGLSSAGLALALGCSLPLFGQQPALKTARIGLVTSSGIGSLPPFKAFHDGLRELGWVRGENLTVEYWFGKAPESVASNVADLIPHNLDLVVGDGNLIIQALKSATDTVPIVMANTNDPVGTGLIASLARPGGNITGVGSLSAQLNEKRLGLLKEAVPRAVRVACIWDPDVSGNAVDEAALQVAAGKLGMQAQFFQTRSSSALRTAFEWATSSGAGALILLTDILNPSFPTVFLDLAATNRLPTMAGDTELARAGSLMAYGPSLAEMFRRAAYYVDRILRGAKPADLPVEQPTTFEFVVNLKTAQALGLAIPQSVLAQATEVVS